MEVRQATVTGDGDDARVELLGTVTNDSASPLFEVTVHLWRSTRLLRSGQVVSEATAATQAPVGRWEPVTDENSAAITDGAASFPPGATREVRVRGTLSELGLTASDTSYWVGMTVVARSAAEEQPTEIVTGRTLLTRPGTTPTRLASVVELSATPRQVRENLFMNDGLGVELQERLTPLLAAAEQGHDWMMDPSLLAEVTDMADGYRVQAGSGTEAGQHAGLAAAWLTRFRALPRDRGWSTLFGQPDLTVPAVLPAAQAAASAASDVSQLAPLITLTAPTPDILTQVAPLNHPVLATGMSIRGRPFQQAGVVVIPALRPAALTPGPALGGSAESRRAVLTALARVDSAQILLLQSPADVAIVADMPHWLARTPLASMSAPPLSPGTVTTEGEAPRPLAGRIADRVTDVVAGVAAYAEATTPEANPGELSAIVHARAAASAWAGRSDDQANWLDAVEARMGTAVLKDGITLDVAPRLSLAGGTSDFPVTVTNMLLDPITITLGINQDNPQRIRLDSPPQTTIAAGASETVLVRAEVTGGGVVRSAVHVQTLTGRRLTPNKIVTVETTAFGLVGWTLVIVSGTILVVSTALRIRQRRSHRKGAGHVR